jgi:hypothetical protein
VVGKIYILQAEMFIRIFLEISMKRINNVVDSERKLNFLNLKSIPGISLKTENNIRISLKSCV